MSGFDSARMDTNLVRAELWSDQIKDILLDKLAGTKYVRWLSGFPDGSQFTIPSIGEIPMREAAEGTPVVYDSMDTGEFNFTIDRYVEAATFITDKAKQDAYYANQLIAMFVPKMRRAIEENLETSIFALAGSQTAANANSINGASHRFVASGNTNTTLAFDDFAKAKFALDKANCTGARVAIIDPSQEYVLNVTTNITNVSNNPRFEGLINTGFVNDVTGMAFVKNIFGFDVYVSNYLSTISGTEAINGDSRGSVTSPSGAVQNVFLSMGGNDNTPFVGAWRQMPNVEYERNKDLRRDEYVMNGRFGLKLYRPESLVTVLSNSTI
jgi:hypothetical protein